MSELRIFDILSCRKSRRPRYGAALLSGFSRIVTIHEDLFVQTLHYYSFSGIVLGVKGSNNNSFGGILFQSTSFLNN